VGDYSSLMFARRASELITKHGYSGVGSGGYTIPPFFLYMAFQAGHSGNNKYLQVRGDGAGAGWWLVTWCW